MFKKPVIVGVIASVLIIAFLAVFILVIAPRVEPWLDDVIYSASGRTPQTAEGYGQDPRERTEYRDDLGFVQIRQTADELLREFDASSLLLERSDILAGGPPKDGILALVDPARVPIQADINPFPDDARMIIITLDGETVVYPVGILTRREVVNDVVGETHVAVTYCPLCDSAMVFDRRIEVPASIDPSGRLVLEFGVSGLLAHSNVLLYDRTHDALWSQLEMRAVSGPLSGTDLRTLPFEMVTLAEARTRFPDAPMMMHEERLSSMYINDLLYASFLESPDTMFPVPKRGRALPDKTLGVGVIDGDVTWFITARSLRSQPHTIQTSRGEVRLTAGEAGIVIKAQPEGIRIAQTFYYAWSAFHPETTVIDDPDSP